MEKSGKSSKSDAPKEKGKKCPGCGHWVALLTEKSCPTTNGAPVVAPAEGINLIRGTGSGRQLQDRDCSGSDDEGAAQNSIKPSATKGNLGGMFGMLRGLEGSKSLSREDMESVLDKMHDHLIAKNVAADTAVQLCESVANKLEGKHRVDMLQDIMDAQHHPRPYVVTFCGVNDMGKSINLAKISFWLLENGFSVLIAACDTCRARAVQQLRTHTRNLSALHPPENHGSHTMVQLFEKGYGKDAADITMEAVAFAHKQGFDVVQWTQLAACKTMPL
ncbi:signal recognition particle receptor subunit alpha isoform X2 [Pontoporia blainvillei]|uniref:Signal recognition particle receptor subunit alpha isoform X2 n=1 Tax=Pontoporia blainvillei TaxID=48723 RepID=A0ABX0SBX9_PONBL|nr:signal recognition particle receptor subunit alpha isoform X2 [Pontoporia blainvillei]